MTIRRDDAQEAIGALRAIVQYHALDEGSHHLERARQVISRIDSAPVPDTLLQVYVPTLTAPIRRTIVPGSAIVSRGVAEGPDYRILVYFEGNLYNAENMRRFSIRVLHAAGRLVTKYPTIALAAVPKEDLIPIGYYWTTPPRLQIYDYLTLEDWLHVDVPDRPRHR